MCNEMQRSKNVQRIFSFSCNEMQLRNELFLLEQRSKNDQRNATNRLQRNATELVACPTLELSTRLVLQANEPLVSDFLSSMENYTLTERIGAGGFGTVHLAENKKDGKQAVVKEKVKWHKSTL